MNGWSALNTFLGIAVPNLPMTAVAAAAYVPFSSTLT